MIFKKTKYPQESRKKKNRNTKNREYKDNDNNTF